MQPLLDEPVEQPAGLVAGSVAGVGQDPGNGEPLAAVDVSDRRVDVVTTGPLDPTAEMATDRAVLAPAKKADKDSPSNEEHEAAENVDEEKDDDDDDDDEEEDWESFPLTPPRVRDPW